VPQVVPPHHAPHGMHTDPQCWPYTGMQNSHVVSGRHHPVEEAAIHLRIQPRAVRYMCRRLGRTGDRPDAVDGMNNAKM
jgi:hypothetical protein